MHICGFIRIFAYKKKDRNNQLYRKVMKTNSIKFSELQEFNDSNSLVLISTTFSDGFDFSEVNDFLSDELRFSTGKNLIGVHFIEDNVEGDEGRKDWLLEFDHEEVQFNPLARLMFPDLKWTSDFIYIYKNDYISGSEVPNDFDEQEDEQ